ncbi:hypothetical protein [Streptomyces daliensis]
MTDSRQRPPHEHRSPEDTRAEGTRVADTAPSAPALPPTPSPSPHPAHGDGPYGDAHGDDSGPVTVPPPGLAEVRVVAGSAEAARQVAEALRRVFAATEQRTCPAGPDGGTRLHLTVDTARTPDVSATFRPWLVRGDGEGDGGSGPARDEER